MSHSEYEAAVADFIRANGVTRCPTACVGRTQGIVSADDREALRQRAEEGERRRAGRRFVTPLMFGKKAPLAH